VAIIKVGSFGGLSASVRPEGIARRAAWKGLRTLGMIFEASRAGVAPPVRFAESQEPRGLALKGIRLTDGFEGFLASLFNPTHEVYFVSWAWDLSGEPPTTYPGAGAPPAGCLIPMRVGKLREFLGRGVGLFPARTVRAGLAVRIQVWESDADVRAFGRAMADVADTVGKSELNRLLTLASTATGIEGATLGLIKDAALELATLVGGVLAANGDDYVDFFEGYYPASDPWPVGEERHAGEFCEIVLSRFQ